jgi:adenylate cyclase
MPISWRESPTISLPIYLSSPEASWLAKRKRSLTAGSPSARGTPHGLGVNYMVQGSIRAAADQIGANVQLIDVETGGHLWARRFDIEREHGQDTRNEIIGRLVCALSMKLTEDVNRRIETLPLEEWTPYDLVMRGRALICRPLSQSNRRAALFCFEEALDAEPESVDARLGVAYVLVANVADGWSDAIGADKDRAERLLYDVIRVDADLPLAHCLMGILRRLQNRLIDSQIELGIAIDLKPNYGDAIGQLGLTLAFLGQPEAAMPHIDRSLRLARHGPGMPAGYNALGLCHLLLDHVDEAIVCLRTALASNRGLFYTHLFLASALGLKGELAEAEAALREATELQPEIGSSSVQQWGNNNPAFAALFDKTIYAGLLRAGLWDK